MNFILSFEIIEWAAYFLREIHANNYKVNPIVLDEFLHLNLMLKAKAGSNSDNTIVNSSDSEQNKDLINNCQNLAH